MVKFVVIDPGSDTGVVFADLAGKRYRGLSAHEAMRVGMDEEDVTVEEYDTSRWWEPGLMDDIEEFMRAGPGGWTKVPLVIEDFILRTADKRRKTLDPIRVTVAVVSVLRDRGWRGKLVLQQPSDAMTTVTDERLRAWKLWIKGSTHKRDAMRHAVLYLRKNMRNPT